MTNESPRIIPETDCAGCGKCCEIFEIAYPNPKNPSEEILIYRSEIERFKLLDEIGIYITSRDEDDVTWLKFDFPCVHLKKDKTCDIYNDPKRPLLCRRFPHKSSTINDCPKVRS